MHKEKLLTADLLCGQHQILPCSQNNLQDMNLTCLEMDITEIQNNFCHQSGYENFVS